MKCVICKTGQTQPGTTTLTLERGSATLVYKAVPAEICDTCGEAYLEEATTTGLLAAAHRAASGGTEVEVQRYAAA